jgi:hypothetical protein
VRLRPVLHADMYVGGLQVCGWGEWAVSGYSYVIALSMADWEVAGGAFFELGKQWSVNFTRYWSAPPLSSLGEAGACCIHRHPWRARTYLGAVVLGSGEFTSR